MISSKTTLRQRGSRNLEASPCGWRLDLDGDSYRDHCLAYPTVDGVVATLALAGLREALDDVRYATVPRLLLDETAQQPGGKGLLVAPGWERLERLHERVRLVFVWAGFPGRRPYGLDLLQSVREQAGVTALHVTHNTSERRRLADRLLLIRDGVVRQLAPDGEA